MFRVSVGNFIHGQLLPSGGEQGALQHSEELKTRWLEL